MQFYDSEAVAPLRERIAEILCDHLGVSKEQLSPSTRFLDDMTIDSVGIVAHNGRHVTLTGPIRDR